LKVEDDPSGLKMWLRRGAWFCVLWLIGVGALITLAFIIRVALA